MNELDVRPIFTAHPTEASRRSVLDKVRRLSDILAESTAEGTSARRRQDRQLAEVIDQMWQTDELRQVRPTPVDEARNAIYYLTGILSDAMPEMLSDLSELLGEHGVSLPSQKAPIRFGSWIGGDRDGNPNVTAAVTREILQIQNQHAVRISIGLIDGLISILSNSTALAGADQELLDSIDVDLENLPGLDRRVLELNAQEPYRLKLTCIKAKLINTGRRVAAGSAHEPGRDYTATAELLAELGLLERSLRNHHAVARRRRRPGPGPPRHRLLRPAPGHPGHPRARRPPPRRRRAAHGPPRRARRPVRGTQPRRAARGAGLGTGLPPPAVRPPDQARRRR